MNLQPSTSNELATAQYINVGQVRERYGVSSSWILRKMRDRGFPQPASRFGGRSRYWLLSELVAWEVSQIHVTDNARHRPVAVAKSETLN